MRDLLAMLMLVAATPLSAQVTSVLSGTVTRAASGEPVAEAIVRIADSDISAATDSAGHFVLRGVRVGPQSLVIVHPELGIHSVGVSVNRAGESFSVAIRVSAAGAELEILDGGAVAPVPLPDLAAVVPVTVTEDLSATPAPAPALRAGTVLDRTKIQELAGSSQNLGDLIRRAIPALQSRDVGNRAGDMLCMEFRGTAARSLRATRSGGECNSPQVYLDGVLLIDPRAAYSMTAFDGLQWIQAIPPGEATAQYGQSPYGVILIATTTGAARLASTPAGAGLLVRSRRHTFDWEQDPDGHPFLRAFLGAAVGNAVGLASGVGVGGHCIYVEDVTREIEKRCPSAGVAGVGLLAFALPALGSAAGAHFGGGTDRSVGRWVPAVLGAGMALFPGYAFTLATVGSGVSPTNTAGKVLLVVGTPLFTALADRMYRRLRNE